MPSAHGVLNELAGTLSERVKAQSSVSAHFSTQLLLDVKTLLNALKRGINIPDTDVDRLIKLRDEIAHATVTSSASAAPFHQTLTDIARKVA